MSQILVIISSDSLLMKNHKQSVKDAWENMLDDFKTEEGKFTPDQKAKVLKVKDFFNGCKVLNEDAIENKLKIFLEENPDLKSHKEKLSKIPQNPEDLIIKSISIGANYEKFNDPIVANDLFLTAYLQLALKDGEESKTDLAKFLTENSCKIRVIRAVQKREEIEHSDGTKSPLMQTENEIILPGVEVMNYGLIGKSRREGLAEELKEYKQIINLMEASEFDKILNSIVENNNNKEKGDDYFESYAKAMLENKEKMTILILKDENLNQETLTNEEKKGFSVEVVDRNEMIQKVKKTLESTKQTPDTDLIKAVAEVVNKIVLKASQGQVLILLAYLS
jgi:hypothetical protein